MNVILVEPAINLRYPNLALLKLSAKYKKLGYNVRYLKGNHYFIGKPDIICIV